MLVLGAGVKLKQPGYLVLLGHSTIFRKVGKEKLFRLEKKVKEDGFYSTACAVCMVFVLQYPSTSQLQRKKTKQPHTTTEGEVCRTTGGMKNIPGLNRS